MNFFYQVTVTIFLLTSVVIHGSRVRRQRRQALEGSINSINKDSLVSNRRILNDQGGFQQQERNPNEVISGKKDSRQYYPYQGAYGYGSMSGFNNPYGGVGMSPYQYGHGQYGSYGGGYNRYPGSYGSYSGYNNRPGYYASNYYPSSGSNYYGGGYFWNHGQKQSVNMFLFLMSLFLGSAIFFNF